MLSTLRDLEMSDEILAMLETQDWNQMYRSAGVETENRKTPENTNRIHFRNRFPVKILS